MIKLGNIYILDVKGAQTGTYNPVLIDNDGEIVLIDSGLPGLLEVLKNEIAQCGFSAENVDKLILTHQDIDHVGSACHIKALNPVAEIICHSAEKPYITWDVEPIKVTQRKAGYEQMNETEKLAFDNFYKAFKASKVGIDKTVEDNDVIGKNDNLLIIHTPGHTPGHICVYIKNAKTLVTGDALNANFGTLSGPNPVYTYDMDMAYESLKKMYDLDIEQIICYHGGIVEKDALSQLKALAK